MSDQPLNLYSILFAALVATIIILIIQLLYYQKQAKKKNLRLIKFYLDRKFLDKIVSKKLNNNYLFLEGIKFISIEELEANEELIGLFKDSINSFDKPAIIEKTENNNIHNLYLFEDEKLIYTKAPYIMNNEEKDSMNSSVRIAKIIQISPILCKFFY